MRKCTGVTRTADQDRTYFIICDLSQQYKARYATQSQELSLGLQGDAALHSQLQQQNSEIASLREQCSNHAKERAALKTILDAKIKALVDDIGQSVSDVAVRLLPMSSVNLCISACYLCMRICL